MGRSGAAFAVFIALACTACSTPAPPPPATSAASTTTRPAPTAVTTAEPAAPFTPAASPPDVTAACPFLGTRELQRILETSEDIITTEEPPDPTFVPGTEFQCRYEGKYVSPWLLDLWIIRAAESFRPAEVIESYKKDCKGPVTPLSGIGDGAFFCDVAGDGALVVTGRRSHGQNRIMYLHTRKHRDEVYTLLAKVVGARL